MLALGPVLMTGIACNTAAPAGGGGGGGGGNGRDVPGNDNDQPDPELDRFQLDGTDADFEDDVAALTDAFNAALACIGETESFTEQENLDALKDGYTGIAAAFLEFVATARGQVEQGSDDVCNLELGDDADFDEVISLITDQRNRGRECMGENPDLDDENTLAFLKFGYVQQMLIFDDIQDAADALLNDATTAADQECGE
jgi:hypothetical protein